MPVTKQNIQYLKLLLSKCVYVLANVHSSVAAAVRGGRPIVQTNKGRRRSLAFSQGLCHRGWGDNRHVGLFGMDLHKAFSINSQSIIEWGRLD